MDVIARPSVTPRSAALPDVEYCDDFTRGGYVKDLALASESDPGAKFSEVADCGEWLVTVTDGGSDNNNSIVISDDAANGYLKITNTDADNDLTSLQLNGEAFKLRAGKTLIFETKLNVTDVSATDFFVGLAITDTSLLSTSLSAGCTDIIGFGCPDGTVAGATAGTSNLYYIASKDSAGTQVDTGTDLTDATDVTLRIEIDGISSARFYVDGAIVGTVSSGLPDNEALTPSIEVRNAAAAAESMSIDIIRVAANR